MRKLGSAREGFFPLLPQLDSDVFVDPAGTTHAFLSTRRYFFKTYFERGGCLLTWSHIPRTKSSEQVESRAGGAGFAADYASHLEAVQRRVAAGDVPVVVMNIEDAVALVRFYYRYSVRAAAAREIVLGAALYAALMVLAVVILAYKMATRHR